MTQTSLLIKGFGAERSCKNYFTEKFLTAETPEQLRDLLAKQLPYPAAISFYCLAKTYEEYFTKLGYGRDGCTNSVRLNNPKKWAVAGFYIMFGGTPRSLRGNSNLPQFFSGNPVAKMSRDAIDSYLSDIGRLEKSFRSLYDPWARVDALQWPWGSGFPVLTLILDNTDMAYINVSRMDGAYYESYAQDRGHFLPKFPDLASWVASEANFGYDVVSMFKKVLEEVANAEDSDIIYRWLDKCASLE